MIALLVTAVETRRHRLGGNGSGGGQHESSNRGRGEMKMVVSHAMNIRRSFDIV